MKTRDDIQWKGKDIIKKWAELVCTRTHSQDEFQIQETFYRSEIMMMEIDTFFFLIDVRQGGKCETLQLRGVIKSHYSFNLGS
jgi:hypothetical protein